MKLGYALANLKLVERNRDWWRGDIPTADKLRYYPAMARSLARIARGGPSEVDYLDAAFAFDNPATPLNLQTYPYELTHKVRSAIDRPTSILDVGGNIGQFSRTAHYLWPEADIDVFEPNPEAFALLERNTATIERIRRFNTAVGPLGTTAFHYEPNRTGTGSFVAGNVAALTQASTILVDVTDRPTDLTGRTHYDLVKIDVEGYELTVIEHLAGLSCDCLYLEGSLGRSKPYTHDVLFRQIAASFGPFEITYFSEVSPSLSTFEMACRFVTTI